jgi:Fibronectin type III domain
MGLVTYNLPPSTCFSANPIRYKIGTDIDLETIGLYVLCKVEFSAISPESFSEQISFPLTPDSLGIVEIDLSRIAHRLVSFKAPTLAVAVQEATTHTGKIRVTFTEYSQDLPTGGTPETMDDVVIIKGGISHERWQSNTWFANRYPDYKLLTWMPQTRDQLPWVNDWITYLHLDADAAAVTAKIITTFTDATTNTQTLAFPASAAKQNKVYHIPAGYLNLNLGSIDPDKTVHYYTIQVFADATAISELVTWYMDHSKPGYETFHLNYFNSIGGFDSMPILGDHTQTVTRDFDLVDTNTSRSNFNGLFVPAMSRMNRVSEQLTYKANIGVTASWTLHDLRRELFLSKEIYTRKKNRWWPVNVLDKSPDFGPVNAQIKEVGIEWAYAFNNTHYTPEIEDFGEALGFEFTTQCPVITYSITDTTIQVSFTHAPAPVDSYEIKLLDQDDIELLSETKAIPYTAPITHTFEDLAPETDYRVHMVMRNNDTGESRTCIYSMVTTNAEGDVDPGTPDEYSFIVTLSNDLGTICSETPTTVYSTDSVLGTGSVIYIYVADEPTPVSGFTLIKTPDGYSYFLSGNTLLSQTGFVC